MSEVTAYGENMKCAICGSLSVNKFAEKTFQCSRCNQIFTMFKINYNCPVCNKIWRENEDGSKYDGWIQLAYVYEHVDRKCPSCREERVGRRTFE